MAGLNLFTNNAATTLASGINNVVTSLTVASTTGGLFPSPTGSQYFYCTLSNLSGSILEIVKVTARSSDTFTIVRGQDGTAAQSFSAGDKVELRLTAADLGNFPQLDSTNTFAQAQTFSTPIAYSSGGTGLSTLGTNGQVLQSNGSAIVWAAAGGSTTLTTTSFTATAGQTTFTVTYTPALLQGVYRNGVKLDPADYTSTSGTAIVLNTGAIVGDNIQVQYFSSLATSTAVNSISFGSTGLTPSTASTGAVTVAGTLATSNGGTGLSGANPFSSGGAVYASSSTTLTSGILPATAGGTNFSGTPTAGGIIYGNGSSMIPTAAGTTGQVLTSQGSSAPIWAAASGGTQIYRQRTLASGTTYTVPSDVKSFYVFVFGSTGGNGTSAFGGKGGRGYSEKYYASPTTSYTYSIGAGGTFSGTTGNAGGSTTFGGVITVTGSSGTSGSSGATGGSGSGGDFNASGGTGGAGDYLSATGGGGGGSGSRAGNGYAGASWFSPGPCVTTVGAGGGTGGAASGGTPGIPATSKAAGALTLPWNLGSEAFSGGSGGGEGATGISVTTCIGTGLSASTPLYYTTWTNNLQAVSSLVAPILNAMSTPTASPGSYSSNGVQGIICIVELLK
jgi:hypothetical protein